MYVLLITFNHFSSLSIQQEQCSNNFTGPNIVNENWCPENIS